MKRIGIYVFYEKDGGVRDYVTYFLKELKTVCSDIVIVVNGNITSEGKGKLKEFGNVLVRENLGYDFGAWKYAFEQYGWKELEKFDELVLCNNSVYGPISSMQEIFNKAPVSDFWGITSHVARPELINFGKDGLYAHIQSYFIVFRKKVFTSDEFHKWWRNVLFEEQFDDVIHKYETKLTKFLEVNGFSWDSIYKSEFDQDPCFIEAEKIISETGSFVKRKLFTRSDDYMSSITNGYIQPHAFAMIKQKNEQLYSFVLDDLLESETAYFSTINKNLQLHKILPSVAEKDGLQLNKKIALIHFGYYPEMADYCYRWLKNVPISTDIFIISSRNECLKAYQKVFDGATNRIEYRLKPNRGRDISAFLVTAKDVFQSYDLVCLSKDKKSPQQGAVHARAFAEHCYMSTLFSEDYVLNIINEFDKNPKLGLIVPPPPIYGEFYCFTDPIGPNREAMKEILSRLRINDTWDNFPQCPFGTQFWCRTDAIKLLIDEKWDYKDFPLEPMPVDGTTSHGIERIWALVAQKAGYYSVDCLPDSYASVYWGLIKDQLMTFNQILSKRYGLNSYLGLKNTVVNDFAKLGSVTSAEKLASSRDIRKAIKYRLLSHFSKKYKEKLKNHKLFIRKL